MLTIPGVPSVPRQPAPLTVHAHRFSASARAAIEEAATAVSRAKKAAKALPSKQARSLDDYIDDARSANLQKLAELEDDTSALRATITTRPACEELVMKVLDPLMT